MKRRGTKVGPGSPITAGKRRRLGRRVKKREDKLRRQYRKIHGKVVDWVNYYTVEDGSLYVSIRFKDKTDFSMCFSPQILADSVELCDTTTDNFEVIRSYEGQEPSA
jgi:hypothetical protein